MIREWKGDEAEGDQLEFGWMDGVKEAFNSRGWTLEQAKEILHDAEVW